MKTIYHLSFCMVFIFPHKTMYASLEHSRSIYYIPCNNSSQFVLMFRTEYHSIAFIDAFYIGRWLVRILYRLLICWSLSAFIFLWIIHGYHKRIIKSCDKTMHFWQRIFFNFMVWKKFQLQSRSTQLFGIT